VLEASGPNAGATGTDYRLEEVLALDGLARQRSRAWAAANGMK
jgi:hypothetical protein